MSFPAFFSRVPTVTLCDPLAELLGAADGGLIEYGFADAVRLTGHACPTVAGAYLLACRMLRRLHGDAVPERGALRCEFRARQDEAVAGVIASVFTLLTGAAGEGGFKGLAGAYGRRNLLAFGVADLPGEVRLTRLDSGAGVCASLDLSGIPADPALGPAMQRALADGSAAERAAFARLWQARVERILIEGFERPDLVRWAG